MHTVDSVSLLRHQFLDRPFHLRMPDRHRNSAGRPKRGSILRELVHHDRDYCIHGLRCQQ